MEKNIIRSDKLVNEINQITTDDLYIDDLLELLDDIEVDIDNLELDDDIAYEILKEIDDIFKI